LTQIAWLAADARELIVEDALKWSPRETGGSLFGYENHGELVITRAYLAGPRAWHFPWLFRPDRADVQRVIDDVFEETGGEERWIGSWHSHPLGRPRPSVLDRRTAGRIGAEEAVACLNPLMLIQTTRLHRHGQREGPLGAFRWTGELLDLVKVTAAPRTIS
jgi:integrative and conjugative element protein (TIGR02256 family)